MRVLKIFLSLQGFSANLLFKLGGIVNSSMNQHDAQFEFFPRSTLRAILTRM